jgi:transposase-like protein
MQGRIASVFEVTQKTISNWFSNFSNTDQTSPKEKSPEDEELEHLERDTAKVGVCVKEIIPAIHVLIERIQNGGALRIV